MFTINESTLDRIVRFVVGVILVYAWYMPLITGAMAIVALVIGLVFMVTGIIGWCPLYTLFHMSTNKSTT